MSTAPRPRRRRVLSVTGFVRIWLPVLVILSGLIAVAVDPSVDGLEGAAHIVGAGLAIWLLNLLVRMGISGQRERTVEDQARAYFMRHGYWPDEAPPGPPPLTEPAAPAAQPAPRPATAPHRRPAPAHRHGADRVRGPHRARG